jgi:hypothetical protein
LLIAALPLQGGAASMLPCVQLTPPVLHGSHCAAEGKSQQQLEQKKVAQQHAHAKCSHCTACASALAPLNAELLLARLTGNACPHQRAGTARPYSCRTRTAAPARLRSCRSHGLSARIPTLLKEFHETI